MQGTGAEMGQIVNTNTIWKMALFHAFSVLL